MVNGDRWQKRKISTVLSQLESGKKPSSFAPISIVLHESAEVFRVEDGISRISAFYQKRIPKITAEIRVGKW
ncbi:hypothetical protein KY320_04490 [Candidatus Woesearchaeota archaeon]|nr:hypothetical protein [Candidatus Woesearchaeota archaeon]